jgi:hypothetical protein
VWDAAVGINVNKAGWNTAGLGDASTAATDANVEGRPDERSLVHANV